MGLNSRVSIIIPCKNEGKYIDDTLASLTAAHNRTEYEIIVVDDASEDNCCVGLTDRYPIKLVRTSGVGSAQARNEGAKKAQGEILVFCDGHIFVENHWLDNLLEPLHNRRLDVICPAIAPSDNVANVGYGQSLNETLGVVWYTDMVQISPVAVGPGACLAVRRGVFQRSQGFESGFQVWGYEDIEFSIKLWLLGYQVWVQPGVKVLHVFRQFHPYRVLMEHVNYNLLRMALLHFNEKRVERVIELLKNQPVIEKTLTRSFFSDVMEKRSLYRKLRLYNDDWFFRKFGIPF
ncbi:MAG: glycosyltransferase [Clostridia bacterium]|nr:glycosyltransferase [Clostridia bacterium]